MTEVAVLTSPAEMHSWRREVGSPLSVGFVPTMGALHDGHRTLIERSSAENDRTVVSVFVNPTQFNVSSDFETYPRTLDQDIQIAKRAGADVVFAPDAATMYPPGFSSYIEPCSAAIPLEGERRPGHFRGVTTIVNKLFNSVSPTRAYFGKKDFQQLAVIRGMVDELNMAIQIVGVETVREADGLAMSSRNRLLAPEDRSSASVIHRAMQRAATSFRSGERDAFVLESMVREVLDSEPRCAIEYAVVCDADTFEHHERVNSDSVLCIACTFGAVRLIDNVELPV